jgi:acid phosphatase (class A)
MKLVFLILMLFAGPALFSQGQSTPGNISIPAARGHYKKLMTYSGTPVNGKERFDSLRFELADPSQRILTLDNGKKEVAARKVPESKCDPEACQPAAIFANGRKRLPHYLKGDELYNIPEPPANSSPQTRAELDYLLQLQSQRTEEDKRASAYYAGVYYRTSVTSADADYPAMSRNLFHIGRSIGTWFHPDSIPLTAQLVANVWKDTEYVIWKYKNYFLRIRPYKLEPALENLEETNWAAYPSGHATNSYVNAYLYQRLIPEFSDIFFKDAYDMAHSREIIGVHYPSDSESGRILAWQVVDLLFQNKEFLADLEKVNAELRAAKLHKGF